MGAVSFMPDNSSTCCGQLQLVGPQQAFLGSCHRCNGRKQGAYAVKENCFALKCVKTTSVLVRVKFDVNIGRMPADNLLARGLKGRRRSRYMCMRHGRRMQMVANVGLTETGQLSHGEID